MLQEATLKLFNSTQNQYDVEDIVQNQIIEILGKISTIRNINIIHTDNVFKKERYVTTCSIIFDSDRLTIDDELNYLDLDYELQTYII